uniref:Uncharacterized protein n=1 Tax=Saccharum spontaneum TaxID=62335 RepID=A0A678TH02_SACSP|nr:hypothetical protein SS16G14_000012 [Saccharum spontaneum]
MCRVTWALANLIVDVALFWAAGCCVRLYAQRAPNKATVISVLSTLWRPRVRACGKSLHSYAQKKHLTESQASKSSATRRRRLCLCQARGDAPMAIKEFDEISRSKIWSLYRGQPALFSLMLPPRVRSDRALPRRIGGPAAAIPGRHEKSVQNGVRERAGESGESEELQRRRRRTVLVFWREKWTPAGPRMLSKSKLGGCMCCRGEDDCNMD